MQQQWCEEVHEGAVLITVNQRLARHLNHRYQQFQVAAGRQWWETPSILPLSAWLQSLHASLLNSGLTECTLMPAVIRSRVWQQCLEEDQATTQLLDTSRAASNALKAWVVAQQWRCPPAESTIDQAAFSRWCASYQRHCAEKKRVDAASLADHIIERLDLPAVQALMPKRLLIAGFISPSAQVHALFEKLRAVNVQVDVIANERKATLHRHAFADDEAALEAIAVAARSRLKNHPDNTIGVVVHDLNQRRAQVLRAFDSVFFPALSPLQIKQTGRPYDVSLGLPLSEQSAIRTALLLLRLISKGLDATQLSSLLMSPYIAGGKSDRRLRENIDTDCRNAGVHKFTLNQLILKLPKDNTFRRGLEKVSQRKRKTLAGSGDWANSFASSLRIMGWPGKAIDTEEFQTVEAWHACLDDLQLLDDGQAMSFAKALSLLDQLCRDRIFQLDTPATPIQIMGRLESHGIEFDQLWVTGMDAEQWPPVTQPTSFLPIAQQVECGVPDASAASRLAQAEKEFALWQSSSHQLNLCHAEARDGMPLLPASAIAHIELHTQEQDPLISAESMISPEHASAQAELLFDDNANTQDIVTNTGTITSTSTNTNTNFAITNTINSIKNSGDILGIDDPEGPAIASGTQVKGGARLLENQARCPFKAFALHRLHIKPLEEPGIGLDARQHGILLHKSLEFFWKDIKTQSALLDLDEDALHDAIENAVEEALKDKEVETDLRDLQRRYLVRLIAQWIEKQEIVRTGFSVVELEADKEIEVSGVKMKLQVDRIDKLDSGESVVLDYKTGQNSTCKSWSEERIDSPQLPLYAMTDSDIKGICFAQVFSNQHKYIGITAESGLINRVSAGEKTFASWDEWRAHWQSALESVASEVQQGVATITPAKKACDYCELYGLCRIDKTTLNFDDAEDPGAETNDWEAPS